MARPHVGEEMDGQIWRWPHSTVCRILTGPLEPRERVTFYWMTGRLDRKDLTEEVTFFFS